MWSATSLERQRRRLGRKLHPLAELPWTPGPEPARADLPVAKLGANRRSDCCRYGDCLAAVADRWWDGWQCPSPAPCYQPPGEKRAIDALAGARREAPTDIPR